MLAKLSVAAAAAPRRRGPGGRRRQLPRPERKTARADRRQRARATTRTRASAALVASTHAGTLSLQRRQRWLHLHAARQLLRHRRVHLSSRATAATSRARPPLVTITVAGVPDAPVAIAQAVGVDAGGNVSVTLAGTDADGDPLQYYRDSSLPAPRHAELHRSRSRRSRRRSAPPTCTRRGDREGDSRRPRDLQAGAGSAAGYVGPTPSASSPSTGPRLRRRTARSAVVPATVDGRCRRRFRRRRPDAAGDADGRGR